jgi:hypothetical protein
MAPLPARAPETDRRWVLRVAPDPYLRFDTCDYSLAPDVVGRRVRSASGYLEITVVALETGSWPVGMLARSLGIGRSPALEHARAQKCRRDGGGETAAAPVETRSLAIYDALIA